MTIKLKQGFFKVTPYNPYVPMDGEWYINENDADFTVMHGQEIAATYYGFSHGCGKITSVFNRDYFVFENGASQVRIVDNDHTVNSIITIPYSDLRSVICMDNFIYVIYLLNTTLTVSKYIVAGTAENPFSDLVETKTINVTPGFVGTAASCVKNATEAFVYQGELSGSYETVKMTIDGSNFELSKENDSIVNLIHPNMALKENNEAFLYYRPMSYYSNCTPLIPGTGSDATTNWSFSVYNSDDVLQYTYTISRTRSVTKQQGAKVFIDQDDGSGYLVVFDTYNSGGSPHGKVRVFSFGGGNISLEYEASTESINVITGSIIQIGCYPWKGTFPGFGYGQNQYISRKALLETSSCSFATASNFTNTSTPMRFGNTIKWL